MIYSISLLAEDGTLSRRTFDQPVRSAGESDFIPLGLAIANNILERILELDLETAPLLNSGGSHDDCPDHYLIARNRNVCFTAS
ncbi:hypothetical protein H8B02_12970 [Bradyrhizobium sp. Pear77]|uniref:hypothetical protein n=1 Tax=Bradyrhizobium altum TaxID=1571202 RepID=UPI001E442C06|nr:hypothetical protein [Bradyrhizobium altum]MCC8954330.1 hypothetical protein [Bradyrhizobium altum]